MYSCIKKSVHVGSHEPVGMVLCVLVHTPPTLPVLYAYRSLSHPSPCWSKMKDVGSSDESCGVQDIPYRLHHIALGLAVIKCQVIVDCQVNDLSFGLVASNRQKLWYSKVTFRPINLHFPHRHRPRATFVFLVFFTIFIVFYFGWLNFFGLFIKCWRLKEINRCLEKVTISI